MSASVHTVLIMQSTPSVMQKGSPPVFWELTFVPEARDTINPLMGWVAGTDTLQQLCLRFDTLDEAIAFAKQRGWHYVIGAPVVKRLQKRSYADTLTKNPLL